MKKKILFIFLCLFTFFVLNINVNAENVKTCIYRVDGYDLTLAFDIKQNGKATRTIVSGSDSKLFSDEGIKNWNSKYLIEFIGKDYFNDNKKCPQHTILIKYYGDKYGSTRFTPIALFKHDVLYVSDENTLQDSLAKLIKHYRHIIFGNRIVDGYPIVLNLEKERDGAPTIDDKDDKKPTSCLDYTHNDGKYEGTCKINPYFACVWNETKFGNYCNVDNLLYVSCGDARDIPYEVPGLTSFAVNLLKIATPIILVIVSMISLIKALAASKEDEIKKAQSLLIKRLIIAVLIFFVITIVQFVVTIVADNSEVGSIESCFKCFLNNKCDGSVYYKANVGATHEGIHNYNGEDLCIYFDGTEKSCK